MPPEKAKTLSQFSEASCFTSEQHILELSRPKKPRDKIAQNSIFLGRGGDATGSPYKGHYISTPIGKILAIADKKHLYSLKFEECNDRHEIDATFGRTDPIDSIEEELLLYFKGQLKIFKTPIALTGTPFQNQVWKSLIEIPIRKTLSYTELAVTIGKPSACRAVAQANGANRMPIIIPCHRVINVNGLLGGYNGGIHRKKWLLEHEQK